jgi:tetratricopeptide (TPR) repeat protein
MNLGENFTASGNPREAIASLRRAQPILDDLVAKDPSDATLAGSHATLALYLGQADAARGNFREARHAFARAVTEYERLKAAGRLPASFDTFLKDAVDGAARCDAALSAKTDSKNPKSRPTQ